MERRDGVVGVQLGVDRMGVGGAFFWFSFFSLSMGDAWNAVREWGRQRGDRDLSDTSSPSFRTESQYSKLPSADKKK